MNVKYLGFVGILFLILGSNVVKEKEDNSEKIIIEYQENDVIKVNKASKKLLNKIDSESQIVTVKLDYEKFVPESDINSISKGELVEQSKDYYSRKNQEMINKLNINSDDIFVSKYTPFVFYTYENKSLNSVYNKANFIAEYNFVENVYIGNDFEVCFDDYYEPTQFVPFDPLPALDDRIDYYDDFPTGTPYTGVNIKIGLLDSGVFLPNHPNFSLAHTEIVYDTNPSTEGVDQYGYDHPTLMANIFGGKYGYAKCSSIYYVDVNSDIGITGIERLIDKDVDVINMSFGLESCLDNGKYDLSLERYLDAIYCSTHVVMVAAAGNYLDISGSGGYVTFPGLCANVITVGAVAFQDLPAYFSSYNIKNDVRSKPNLTAVGDLRGVADMVQCNGTSTSCAAVTGAIALFFEKNGVKDMPTTLAALTATADFASIVDTTMNIPLYEKDQMTKTGEIICCTNNLDSTMGYRERTGAGSLNITRLLASGTYFTTFSQTSIARGNYTLMSNIYVEQGKTLDASIAWYRRVNDDSSYPLPQMTVSILDSSGNVVSNANALNCDNLVARYKAVTSGYYSIRLNAGYFSTSITHVGCAYGIR